MIDRKRTVVFLFFKLSKFLVDIVILSMFESHMLVLIYIVTAGSIIYLCGYPSVLEMH